MQTLTKISKKRLTAIVAACDNNGGTTHNNRIALTPEIVAAHIGDIIAWYCYGYSRNMPYSGMCKIKGVQTDERNRTVLMTEYISGSNLSNSWIEHGTFNFTDSGRLVYIGKEFENYTLMWECPNHNMLFCDNTAMQYSITHYINGNTTTLEQRIAMATTADKVIVKETGIMYVRDADRTFKQVN